MSASTAPGAPDDVDPNLWFEMTGCDGRHFLIEGNPHITGRMYACCPAQRDTTRVSKDEITVMSDEAAYFVRGFLSGSEPGPPLDEEGMLVADEAAVNAWRRAVAVFRETGVWQP